MPANKEWYLKVEGNGIYIVKKRVEDSASGSGSFALDIGPLVAVRAYPEDQLKVKVRVICNLKLLMYALYIIICFNLHPDFVILSCT